MNIFSCFRIKKKKLIKEEIKNTQTECVICLEDMKENDDFLTKCNHRFHKECLNDWISIYSNTECPICRKKLGLYLFENKKQRKQRIKKQIIEEELRKKEQELLENMRNEYIREQMKIALEIERERHIEHLVHRRIKNDEEKKRFFYYIDLYNINLNRRYNLDNIDFIECISVNRFFKQYKKSGHKIGYCNLCRKSVYKKRRFHNNKMFHIECHRIYKCAKYHNHN